MEIQETSPMNGAKEAPESSKLPPVGFHGKQVKIGHRWKGSTDEARAYAERLLQICDLADGI